MRPSQSSDKLCMMRRIGRFMSKPLREKATGSSRQLRMWPLRRTSNQSPRLGCQRGLLKTGGE